MKRGRNTGIFLLLPSMANLAAAQPMERDFPVTAVDHFAAMDDGIALTPEEVQGRNTWLMWTAGDEAFWDYLARRSFGAFDLLKVLDSRNRSTRFSYYGLMNEPGFKQAAMADKFALWLDAPDATRAPCEDSAAAAARCNAGNKLKSAIYGHSPREPACVHYRI